MLLSQYDLPDSEEERLDGCAFSSKAFAFGLGFIAGAICIVITAVFVLAIIVTPAIIATPWLR